MRSSYILPILLVLILISTLNQSAEHEILLQLHSFNVTQSGSSEPLRHRVET